MKFWLEGTPDTMERTQRQSTFAIAGSHKRQTPGRMNRIHKQKVGAKYEEKRLIRGSQLFSIREVYQERGTK